MNFIDDVSPEKLRGGFYTPPSLVNECFDRIARLVDQPATFLEPSAGDGAFLHVRHHGKANGRFSDAHFTCIERSPEEAAKCRTVLRASTFKGKVINDSFFNWAENQEPQFDAVVGNPPFVRYQFVTKEDRSHLERLVARGGNDLDGVANLWIPFTLISLELLKHAGAFALVLPSELLATKSAGLIRSEFVRHFGKLQIDLYPRGTFAGILQDVIVVSGVRDVATRSRRVVTFRDHSGSANRQWSHEITDSKKSWTRYLLAKKELAAIDAACRLQEMHRLGEVATIGVSIVTGANDFFTVDDETLQEYELQTWAKPLLGRTAESLGIVFKKSDHTRARKLGKKAWILDFSSDLPDPLRSARPKAYIEIGENQGLSKRYKCRIRTPWYRIPYVRCGSLLLSKRAHYSHRLISNHAKVYTTDTIYRGTMKRPFMSWKQSLVAGFHNSLTILTSELEGRTYGGGVLEMVPSEITRLVVPLVDANAFLPVLDKLCREVGGQIDADDTLINATDEIIASVVPNYATFLPELITARLQLRNRRFFGS